MKLKFPKKTKIRIIADNIGIFTTVGKYASVFVNGKVVNATLMTLLEIQRLRDSNEPVVGVCGRWFDVNIQVDLI